MAKQSQVTIPASKRNCNRVKYHTHTLEKVLRIEGYQVVWTERNLLGVQLEDQIVDLRRIELTPRRRSVIPVAVDPKVEAAVVVS